MKEYSVLITYIAETEEELAPLYKSPNDGTSALVQQIYELARQGREQGIVFSWKEGSELK